MDIAPQSTGDAGSGSGWDAHTDIEGNHSRRCRASDKPVAGLISGLKSRGMLKDTLVVWDGKFGRTPFNEKGNSGLGLIWTGGWLSERNLHPELDPHSAKVPPSQSVPPVVPIILDSSAEVSNPDFSSMKRSDRRVSRASDR